MTRHFYKALFCTLLGLAAVADSVGAQTPEFRGQWQQGGTIFGKVPAGHGVRVDGRQVKTTPNGDFVFGLGPDAAKEVKVEVVAPDGTTAVFARPVVQREYKVQRVNGVEEKHVTPPAELTERIQREAELVNAARRRVDERADFLQDFIWPVTGPITGVYGSRRVYNGTPRSPHYGLDIAAPTGTKVVAPAAGIVTLAEGDLFYSGGTLIVDHGYGLSSTFIHLHKILVKVGERVEQGQAIAEVGATGRVTGPHLDWRMNWFDVRLDPALVMADKPMPKGTQD
ncbi:M23 family peptidase [Saccharophagus sp. K07]|uniref:M23 family metallopeptidase n=1 Tax=Saccharophagus sp. K07 TaxID=2283636 RepID=UPI0016529AC0|nr:M23 family metallopeptidase [Saccharophagus sp. K07]MBC6904731.1 M23 family peptidase [Saccharophagus sp. K07]